ncbi:hypothetical protein FB567DRAFT_9700 [Paraphoma chrysanthemicola]|uniref:Uncharacterized protein n=1 Tax=Paraphoma chrysanthemicola TaxID=798071 RepID=A0A8K0RIX8_9PLEO|nr:hypothetical protein FB567DRAFT_9700 [Paraphoma chrysanthemicola]
MPDNNDTVNTALVICFGILTIIVTIAGFHVRDSVFCSCFRGLFVAWSRNNEIDIEARAGVLGEEEYQDNTVFELQPRVSLPLYYEPHLNEEYSSE